MGWDEEYEDMGYAAFREESKPDRCAEGEFELMEI